MNNFVKNFKQMDNITETENGGRAFCSTGTYLLDFFSNIGGMRNRSDNEIISAWLAARNENSILADNLILYARDIRNAGLGERKIGRLLMRELAKIDAPKIIRNLQKIVDIGRWDDLFVFIGTPVEDEIWKLIKSQLREDFKAMRDGAPVSLLGKWLKSENTSSEESRLIAKKTRKALGLTSRTYRKILSSLRKYIDVVERKMSAKEWDSINFEAVPSVAMNRYIKTYNKHCQDRFAEYKASLEKGEAKVNAATLYPYDITMKWLNNSRRVLDPVDEAQWKALPNYVNENYDIVILADVSGSMTLDNNRPIATSIGLATYFAQRNKGAYHNMYMTFTNDPHFISIKDDWSLSTCLKYVENKEVGYNTDLDRAFEAIYEIAKVSREAPRALVVISDMEIDRWYCGDFCSSIAKKWEKEYESIGLKAPKLILWNVESRNSRVLATQSDNVAFVSGYGVSPFKNLTTLIEKDAYSAMVEILSQGEFQWE